MATVRLTKATLKSIEPTGKATFLWDADLSGFGVRVAPGGKASFVVQYRQGKATKRVTLGGIDTVKLDRARERAGEILATVALKQEPFPVKTAAPTLGAVADEFLAHAEAKSSPRTHADYKGLVDRHIRPKFGARELTSITRAEIENWHDGLRATPRRGNYALVVLVAIYSFAVRRRIIGHADHPALGVRKYPEVKRTRYLDLDELGRFGVALARLEGERSVSPWAAAAIRLLILTGARSSEILTLKWSMVDLSAGVLRLDRSKTGPKAIVLSAAAQAVLRATPKVEGVEWVIAGRRHGEAMTSLQRPFGVVCSAAGIEGLRVHDLRHSAASIATSAGVGLPVVGALLGQSQMYTQQRYSHIHNAAERAAAETIGAAAGPLIGMGTVLVKDRKK